MVLKSGVRLLADLVILALGVRPEIGLAKDCGLEIGARGGIRVKESLQTSDPRIYAAGDAIEVRNAVTGDWDLLALGGPANRQGRVVADNIFGRHSRYAGTFGTAVVRVFTQVAACTGANEKLLREKGIPHRVVHLHPFAHARYFPGAQPIALKVVFSQDTGRLLGAQAVGTEGIDKRIDVLATAMGAGMTVHDLADLELAYAPPFGSAKDPVNLAGMAAQNLLHGDVRAAYWYEVEGLDPQKTLVLDVRSKPERDQGAIPGSHHIPLGQLRSRIHELPTDREIVVHCQSGQRSYYAARLLSQKGFRVRNLSGSYRTWKASIHAKRPTASEGPERV